MFFFFYWETGIDISLFNIEYLYSWMIKYETSSACPPWRNVHALYLTRGRVWVDLRFSLPFGLPYQCIPNLSVFSDKHSLWQISAIRTTVNTRHLIILINFAHQNPINCSLKDFLCMGCSYTHSDSILSLSKHLTNFTWFSVREHSYIKEKS